MDHVFVHLVEGFEEIEALATVDILRRADIEVTTISLTGDKVVTGSHNIPVVADLLFQDADYVKATMLFLPGGPGASKLGQHNGFKEHLLQFASDKKWISAICAAPTVLGAFGILDGKKATCYPGLEDKLTGAVTVGDDAITDNNIITGRGAGATFAFALEIVKQLKGASLANELAKKMVIR